MQGYQNNPKATAAVIDKNGFFDTGATRRKPVLLFAHASLCFICLSAFWLLPLDRVLLRLPLGIRFRFEWGPQFASQDPESF